MDHRKVVWVPVKEVFWWVGWNEFITEGEKPENHKACYTFDLIHHNHQVNVFIFAHVAILLALTSLPSRVLGNLNSVLR